MDQNVREYLIHCYLYYKLGAAVISDGEFDTLCKKLLSSGIDHPLVSKEDLAAGTGYSIGEYPPEIISEAQSMLESIAETPSDAAEEPFMPNTIPTWLLLGLYVDYGYARQRDRQELLQCEIKKRWDEGIDRGIFERYFKDHRCGLERFKIK